MKQREDSGHSGVDRLLMNLTPVKSTRHCEMLLSPGRVKSKKRVVTSVISKLRSNWPRSKTFRSFQGFGLIFSISIQAKKGTWTEGLQL